MKASSKGQSNENTDNKWCGDNSTRIATAGQQITARGHDTATMKVDTMPFAWMGDDVEAILLVFAVTVAFVAFVVVLDLKLHGL